MSNIIFVKEQFQFLWQEHAMTWIRDANENSNELLHLCPWTVKHAAAVCAMQAELLQFWALALCLCLCQKHVY